MKNTEICKWNVIVCHYKNTTALHMLSKPHYIRSFRYCVLCQSYPLFKHPLFVESAATSDSSWDFFPYSSFLHISSILEIPNRYPYQAQYLYWSVYLFCLTGWARVWWSTRLQRVAWAGCKSQPFQDFKVWKLLLTSMWVCVFVGVYTRWL